jgi:hypothetical protein
MKLLIVQFYSALGWMIGVVGFNSWQELGIFLFSTTPRTAHCIGAGRPIPWPPHSPDLTSLDFFFCEFVRDIVYCEKVKNVNELLDRIIRVTECLPIEMFANTCKKILHFHTSYVSGIEIY